MAGSGSLGVLVIDIIISIDSFRGTPKAQDKFRCLRGGARRFDNRPVVSSKQSDPLSNIIGMAHSWDNAEGGT